MNSATTEDSIITRELRSRLRDLRRSDTNELFAEITFDPAFRGFEGHFEGNPIVPGVCLLSLGRLLAEELTGRSLAVTEIGQCRFRRPIRAGECARCRAAAEADAGMPGAWRICAEIRCEEAVACQLRMKAVAR